MTDLPPHSLALPLLRPQIAPNTGNIARTCVATGTALHLVRPLGFVLSDRKLQRSAMDAWDRLKLTLHDDAEAFFNTMRDSRIWRFDSAGKTALWQVTVAEGEVLVFGSEGRGMDPAHLQAVAARTERLPQIADHGGMNR